MICSKCFSRIGRGYNYGCNSLREKVSNVQKLLSDTPTTTQRFASRLIYESETPVLSTLGSKPKDVSGSPGITKKELFSVDEESNPARLD